MEAQPKKSYVGWILFGILAILAVVMLVVYLKNKKFLSTTAPASIPAIASDVANGSKAPAAAANVEKTNQNSFSAAPASAAASASASSTPAPAKAPASAPAAPPINAQSASVPFNGGTINISAASAAAKLATSGRG